MDVHIFDHQLTEPFKDKYEADQKRNEFSMLLPQLSTPAQVGLHLIMRDIDQPANYDSTNSKAADDLLCSILNKLKGSSEEFNKDIIQQIDLQLTDMVQTAGFCPQGRTIRLWQVYSLLN